MKTVILDPETGLCIVEGKIPLNEGHNCLYVYAEEVPEIPEGQKINLVRKESENIGEQEIDNTGNATIELVLIPVDELLEKAKKVKLQELEVYDKSTDVNSFLFNNEQMWINKQDRLNLINSIKAESELGDDQTTITLPNEEQITLFVSDALNLLYRIEKYAKQCYNVTKSHSKSIKALTTVNDVEQYDITLNYPEKITYNQ